MRKLLLFIIFIFFILSSTFSQIEVIKVNPGKARIQNIKELVSSVEYIRLKVPADLYFAGITKVIIRDGYIYILDISQAGECKLFCFNIDGNFIYIIDNQGLGPGEYEHIQNISLTDKSLILSVSYNKIMFFQRSDGKYQKTEKMPDETSSQIIATPDDNTIVAASGRYSRNTSNNQLKIYDIKQKRIIHEAGGYDSPALKLGHSFRYLYYYNSALSYLPMYSQTIYRIKKQTQGYLVEPAWQMDFGKCWIDEDILKESYNDRGQFFDAAPKFVHTVDVFETDQVVYLHYRYKNREYTHLYHKGSKNSLAISEFSDNSIGWIGKPLTTWNNYIVNIVTPFDAVSGKFSPDKELKKEFDATDEEGRPVLVFVKFDY